MAASSGHAHLWERRGRPSRCDGRLIRQYDLVIVGGGIIGCATALSMLEARPGMRLALVEKESQLSRHQSGRNSGVIHSGLYYKPESLKARYSREGYTRLVEFCRAEDIPHEICGKIVAATSRDEISRLRDLHRRGTENGLRGVRWLEREEIREVEPHCAGVAGILVPEAGIVDYAAVARRCCDKAIDLGAEITLGEEVVDLRSTRRQVDVIGRGRAWSCRVVVVCAGLQSDRLARRTETELPVAILPFRGEYYELTPAKRHLVRNLIYPVPDPAFPFLGVHFTRTIRGRVECGPNAVLALGREAYGRTELNLRDTWEALTWPGFRKMAARYWRTGLAEYHRSISRDAFVRSLRKLVPEVEANHLVPGGTGIRAQACDRAGNLMDDFLIRRSCRVIHVLNAPSPAATSSLAIARTLSAHALAVVN